MGMHWPERSQGLRGCLEIVNGEQEERRLRGHCRKEEIGWKMEGYFRGSEDCSITSTSNNGQIDETDSEVARQFDANGR
jgi:hypothetical protein